MITFLSKIIILPSSCVNNVANNTCLLCAAFRWLIVNCAAFRISEHTGWLLLKRRHKHREVSRLRRWFCIVCSSKGSLGSCTIVLWFWQTISDRLVFVIGVRLVTWQLAQRKIYNKVICLDCFGGGKDREDIDKAALRSYHGPSLAKLLATRGLLEWL